MRNSGQFKPGREKSGGRKAGTPNKDASKIREFFSNILSDNLEKIQADLDSLEAKDRLHMLVKIAEFCLPKLTSISGELVMQPREILIVDNTEHGLP